MIIEEVKKELTGHIIPFWNKLRDDENGGFYGFMSYDLKLDKQADKGVILHARILWFYSKAYITLGDKTLLDNARHAYEFIKNHCIDYEYGGVYWMMNYKGEPADTMKHTYNIAFAIYALSCYYNASGDKEALELAYKLFHDIENNTLDEYGYREAFDRQWNLVSNDALSENGLHADKTMNAILHLIEAYTELYKADHNEEVAKRLKFQLGGIPLIGLIRAVADIGPDRRYLCGEPQKVQGCIPTRDDGPMVTSRQCFCNCVRVSRYVFIKQLAVFWLFINTL